MAPHFGKLSRFSNDEHNHTQRPAILLLGTFGHFTEEKSLPESLFLITRVRKLSTCLSRIKMDKLQHSLQIKLYSAVRMSDL